MPRKQKPSSSESDPWYAPSRPRPVADGIAARTTRGAFGASWWGKRWIAALEQFGWGSRLQRGRSYARKGQVISLELAPGQVQARVQGSARTPYRVTLGLPVLTDAQWAGVTDALAQQAIFAAQLLAGEMPQEIEQVFAQAGAPLFPQTASDLATRCSCPDIANPCKHIAAVYYLLGERFDDDPFLIFQLRGRTQAALLAALRERRASPAPAADESRARRVRAARSARSVLRGRAGAGRPDAPRRRTTPGHTDPAALWPAAGRQRARSAGDLSGADPPDSGPGGGRRPVSGQAAHGDGDIHRAIMVAWSGCSAPGPGMPP